MTFHGACNIIGKHCECRCGGIAQLARAFGSYPECRRFKSHCRYHFKNKERRIRGPPLLHIWPDGQAVKTPPFHGGNTGSIPVRVTKKILIRKSGDFIFIYCFFILYLFTCFNCLHHGNLRRPDISCRQGRLPLSVVIKVNQSIFNGNKPKGQIVVGLVL